MKKLALIILISFLISSSGLAVFDYLGTNEKYGPAMEENYKSLMAKDCPEAGLLDVSCFFWEDYVSISATIDNATAQNVRGAVMEGSFTYLTEYYKNKWPNKAVVYVNKAGGNQIGTGTIYSKWVDDLFQDGNPPKDSANHVFVMKVWNATRIWTWQL